ncbi:MAG TPA: helix-turn-helix transcriptional regulator [Thermoanaerobaculia bacterium]|nr:helix-turn-helix transcriptional regulator [Thermoanaerobaculia bacterium]
MQLVRGTFFGEAERELRTPSFGFAERIALVPDREVPEHMHTSAHFVLVVRGTYVSDARNVRGLCGPSTLIFNPTGTTHRDRFRSDLGRFFTIDVAPAAAAQIEARHPVAMSLTSHDALAVVLKAQRESRAITTFSNMVLEGLGLELVGRLIAPAPHPGRTPPRWLQQTRDAIHDRCTERVTVAELAHEARVHPVHLARAFRQYFHRSPGEYLRRCRIDRVSELLRRSDLPLSHIALITGFADQSQMTKAFRSVTGLTPSMFRFDKTRSVHDTTLTS